MINQLLPDYDAIQQLKNKVKNNLITHDAINCYEEEMNIMLSQSSKIYQDQDFVIHRLDRCDDNNNRIMKYFYSYDNNMIGCLKFIISDFYHNINLTPGQLDYNVLVFNVQLTDIAYRQLIECSELFFKNISKAYYMIPSGNRNYFLPDREINKVWKILNRSDLDYVMMKMTTSRPFASDTKLIDQMMNDYRMMKITKK
jgi:hypothetical protein